MVTGGDKGRLIVRKFPFGHGDTPPTGSTWHCARHF